MKKAVPSPAVERRQLGKGIDECVDDTVYWVTLEGV